jgi:glycosyltransferase involved in cell wall biosynthesis
MEICIVASNYPTEKRQVHVFLDNVVTQFVNRGYICNIIAPQSIFSFIVRKKLRREFVSYRTTSAGLKYIVYSPLYNVYPALKYKNIHLSDLSKESFFKAVERTYRKYSMEADLVYAHFFQAGIPAVQLAQKLNIPSFIANGEADTMDSLKNISKGLVLKTLKNVTGIISVSTKNKDEVSNLCDGNPSIMKKVTIIPNAADSNVFYHKDRNECRKVLGIRKDAFIVAYTGSFIERKGPNRLAEAIDRIGDIGSIFIGSGPFVPQCNNILFCGRVKNTEICTYLNAADVFVLPTLAEGCSNAIMEALACGLPIISSDLSFNHDVLDETCSILVDPMDVQQISDAIEKLKTNLSIRVNLSEGSMNKSLCFSLSKRVDHILTFIKISLR